MATETLTQTIASLTLHTRAPTEQKEPEKSQEAKEAEQPYRYTNLLPVFPNEHYPPLEPYEHVDPGNRALNHHNPRSFLDAATRVDELTPNLGTEIHGVNLARLTNYERDQVALEVARRGLLVFRDQDKFINGGPDFFLEWGRHFGRLHIHPTSGHPDGYPELHLVYRDANTTFNFEYEDSITSTVWHSDVSYELQPPGLTTFFLLAQPYTGGDTLFTSQVSTLKKLSPAFIAFLKTLKAVHSGVEQADFSRSGRRGGVVRREPVEHVHPVVRRHPVTGEEALYVNKQFTRRILGLKKEESQNILNFLYEHIAASGDCQTRLHWSPNTVVLWDNRITAHSAIADYGKGLSTERRHGARITPQAERPIPAWDGLEL
ncbi:TauD-domain-containing protein [Fomitiporia mediterranea MF3/22]|uniref:TauD-domain-containing protein n=1 Tax=Fomitiporia mediterranea (strain MF3/22) TaxID=694068 RepID=UPI0004408F3E|nr:TauD-domain-containing protein [Fomitiporia mediterranea MF3/22]EJD04419.1 TauD-domain-containing protein [Fomitiporia mediterranea MF3/22]